MHREPPSNGTSRRAVVALSMGASSWALLAAGPLYDNDGWWHLRTGEWILDHHRIPRADPFSWTAAGADWQPNAWLFDVLFALVHRAGGLVAVSLYKSVAVMALAFALFALCRAAGSRAWPAALAAFAGVSAVFLFLSERPQALSYLLFVGALVLARRALDGSARAVVGLGALVALWANLHGAFVTGVAVVAVVAAGDAVQRRRWRWPLVVLAVVAAAGLCNAYGVGALTHAADIRSASAGIREWQHFDPFGWPDRPIAWFVVAAAVAIARTGRWRQPAVVLPLGLLVALTADALRSGPFLVIAAAPELALGLGTLRMPRIERRSVFLAVAVAGWATTLTALVPFAVDNAGTARTSSFPTGVVEEVPRGCRVLNEYGHGGFLGWERPDVRVSQDSRNDVFGPDRLRAQEAILDATSPSAALAWLDRNDVECVVARHGRRLVDALDRSPGWNVVATDDAAVLLVTTD